MIAKYRVHEVARDLGVSSKEILDLLAQRVDGLPPEVQTVIKLRFYEELSLREISEATGWNLNTVKTRLYTALKKLRVSLEGEEMYG